MNKFLIGGAVALALSTTSLSAAPIHAQSDVPSFGTGQAEQLWLAQGNGNGGSNKKQLKVGNAGNGNAKAVENGNGGNGKAKADNGNGKTGKGNANSGSAKAGGNGNGKPEHVGGQKAKQAGNDSARVSNGNNVNGNGKGRRVFTQSDRDDFLRRISDTPAPAGRDMTLLGTTALALATPQLVLSDIPDDVLITYRNCPPGLAKKDPPCVPPGLARDGVDYDEWVSYDQDRYDEIWRDRRDEWLGRDYDFQPDPEYLLLQSDQIAMLYDLAPAPEGQRYALIDGQPVLLDQDDYRSLLLVNQMARAGDIMPGVPIAPTAALTQDELMNLYRLPQLGAGQNYAVLNGQIVQLNDSEYELLQLLRIARAVL